MAQSDLKIVVTLYHKDEVIGEDNLSINDDIFNYKKEREFWLLHKIEQVSMWAVKKAFNNYDKVEWGE